MIFSSKSGQQRWNAVVGVLEQRFHEADVQGARAVYAAVAAHRLQGQPVWPMAVAPPGSLKTEILDALRGLPHVHFIDSVTPNTFISGQILEGQQGRQAPGLLDRIGQSGILVIADFSTVLSMPRDKRASILADMRRIFDGDLRKEYGTTEGSRAWSGRITFLVGATPDVDRHYAIFQTLGERFVMVRWHRPGGVKAAIKAMNQDLQAAKLDMKTAVQALIKGLPEEGADVSLTAGDQLQLAALAEFTVRARTQVPRDGFKDIIYTPEPEAPTRLAQQLCQLAKGSALLVGRRAVAGEDLDLVRRVAFDCIPATRRQVLDHAIQTENGQAPPDLTVQGSSLFYCRGDLEALELLNGTTDLSDLAKELLTQVGIIHQKSPPNEVEKEEELVTVGEGG